MVNKTKNGIVWIRTPKCATSTLFEHLSNYADNFSIPYTERMSHDVFPPKKYINLGHLWAGEVNWDVVRNEKRAVISSVRHPLDRFLSHYKHNLNLGRYNQYGNDVSSFYLENYHNTHFERYFRGMDNYLCKYLDVGNDDGFDKDIIMARYDFITVAEYLKESLIKFENIVGYKFQNKDLILNSTEYNLIISDEFLDLFNKNNKSDLELYQFVLKHYNYKLQSNE